MTRWTSGKCYRNRTPESGRTRIRSAGHSRYAEPLRPVFWRGRLRPKPVTDQSRLARQQQRGNSEPDSHRVGQGFKSPQLHAFPQVKSFPAMPPACVKIICHPDVTRMGRELMTHSVPR